MKSNKISFILGSIVIIIVLMIVLSTNGPLLSPEPNMMIGCGLGRGSFAVAGFSPTLQEPSTPSTTQDPVPGNPPPI
ncbi:MAG: hypothetical protein AABX96_02935 [Nanoarchaeota archaeon]